MLPRSFGNEETLNFATSILDVSQFVKML